MTLVIDGQFRGLANESFALTGVERTEYTVSADGILSILPVFAQGENGA